jgi:HSP20 family molecular chaperone IbpA
MFDLMKPNSIFNELLNTYDVSSKYDKYDYHWGSNYKVKVLDDGKLQLSFNVIGYNPNDILVETNDSKLFVKSNAETIPSPLSQKIDYEFTIHKDYDTSKVNAEIKNGLLTVEFTKKEEKLNRKIEIKY